MTGQLAEIGLMAKNRHPFPLLSQQFLQQGQGVLARGELIAHVEGVAQAQLQGQFSGLAGADQRAADQAVAGQLQAQQPLQHLPRARAPFGGQGAFVIGGGAAALHGNAMADQQQFSSHGASVSGTSAARRAQRCFDPVIAPGPPLGARDQGVGRRAVAGCARGARV